MTRQITLVKDKILSGNYFTLRSTTYDLTRKDGKAIRHRREVYDRDNDATTLLYSTKKETIVLVHQFRVATWVNGNESGQLVETYAGLLDDDEPGMCIRKRAIEKTGYEVGEVRELLELYMSPGGVTELIYFFIAEYSDSQRVDAGGGVESEDIEAFGLPFDQALEMIKTGGIRDGKTVLLFNCLQMLHLVD